MSVTVRDIMTMEGLDRLELIAGSGGLSNGIIKVGILDFEFTKLGSRQSAEEHWWRKNEFVLSTFLYAKDNPALMLDAVKKLHSYQTSGLAIKNIFFLEIPKEVILYANQHNYPLFAFTDHSVFFEDIIVQVHDLIKTSEHGGRTEEKIHSLLRGNHDKSAIKSTATEINLHFKNYLQTLYFAPLDESISRKLPFYLSRGAQKGRVPAGSSMCKYGDGFFYIATADKPDAIDIGRITESIKTNIGADGADFRIGVSDAMFYLTNFKKSLLQSWYAAIYCEITEMASCFYKDTGAYQILFSSFGDEWAEDFYESLITPLTEHDANYRTNLMEVAMMMEECGHSVRKIAARLSAHENTIRYKMAQISKILDREAKDTSLAEHLSLAVKIHRLKICARAVWEL